MTKLEALRTAAYDLRSENLTKTSFARTKRALRVLGFSDEEMKQAFIDMGYYRTNGEPAQFLVKAGLA